jgi:hypothetical protein
VEAQRRGQPRSYAQDRYSRHGDGRQTADNDLEASARVRNYQFHPYWGIMADQVWLR